MTAESATEPDTSRRGTRRLQLLERMPKGGIAAEIGVWEGRFSERILDIVRPAELHLIDPWLYQPEFANTGFGRKKNADRMDQMYHDVTARFAGIPAVRVHRAPSSTALQGFPDAYFDWVYVDGNHNDPFVSQDLDLCRRKVKPGGIIAGDDFNWRSGQETPVKDAVQRLVAGLGAAAKIRLLGNQYMIRLPK